MKKLNILIIILLFSASAVIYPRLPDLIPMHWNIRGEVNSFWPKSLGTWLLPVLTLLFSILFHYLPGLDPKKENYRLFKNEWAIIQTGFTAFFAYLQFIVLYISLKPSVPIMPLMFSGLGFLFILLGYCLPSLRQNYFIGIKVPWTLSSEDNWDKTHRFGGWCFMAGGIVMLLEALVSWSAPIIIFGVIFATSVLPVIYSFLLFKQAKAVMNQRQNPIV